MLTKKSAQKLLMQQEFSVLLGVPFTRIPMTGTIDGTNKDFTLDANHYPIYPRGDANITVGISDVTPELGMTSGQTTTYTAATATAIKTIVDPTTGQTVPAGVTLSTAPAIASSTSVVLTAVEQLEPCVCQSFEPKVKQESKTEGMLGSTDTLTGYGTITNTFDLSLAASNATMKILNKLISQTYSGADTVEPGYSAYEQCQTPISIYAMALITDPATQEIGAAYKFTDCQIPPDMLAIKDKGDATVKLTANVQGAPIILQKTTA